MATRPGAAPKTSSCRRPWPSPPMTPAPPGFNIAVGVGKMMKDKYGTDVRVLPAGNDVARLAPLRAKRALVSAMGSGTYFAQEGVFEFGAREWGPQPLQTAAVVGRLQRRLARRRGGYRRQGDQGPQRQARRLRGRLARAEPELACGARLRRPHAERRQDRRIRKLRRDVEGPDQQRHRRRLRHHHHRAGEGSRDLAARHRSGRRCPPSDKAGWARMQKVGSFFFPQLATCGAGISPEKPIELGNYPYPIFVAYASQPADQVYPIAKAMIVSYDAYKDPAPGAGGLAAEPPDQELGGAGASRRREGAEGGRPVEPTTRKPTTTRCSSARRCWLRHGPSTASPIRRRMTRRFSRAG